MQIAYAGVSPDQQSLPWAPGMGGTAAPVGTLAGAPAAGLDFLAALLAQTTTLAQAATPEVQARAPIHHDARTPVVRLAQALASADASCPSLSFAGSEDAVRTAPASSGEIALDPPPAAARVDEKRALLAGALAILPAPWTLPVFPVPSSAAPASEAATPQVEVSAREKLLALIAMAQGAAPSATLPAGPGGDRFAQTNSLMQPTFAAAPDLERGQIVAPQPSSLPEIQALSPAELSATAALQSPAATRFVSSAPSRSLEAPETQMAPTTPVGSAPTAAPQAAPPAPEMSRPATVAAVTAAPAAKDAGSTKRVAATGNIAAMTATVTAAAATLQPSQSALQEAPANHLIQPSARQDAALPDLPSGERVILEAAPVRPQPMDSDAGLEQVERVPRPFVEYATAPADVIVATVEELPARALPQAPGPASEAWPGADGHRRAFPQPDPVAAAPMPAGTAADASPAHADRMSSADLRSQGAQTVDPDATLVVPVPRQDVPTVPPSVAAIPPTMSRLSGGERPQIGPAFAVPTTQGMRSDAVEPVVFGHASPGADFVAPVVAATADASALSSPADPERHAKVDPTPDSVEQLLRPSSPMANRAMAVAPAASEPQSAKVDPAPVGPEQSLRPSSPPPSRAAEVVPATSEPQPVRIDLTPVGVEQSRRSSASPVSRAMAVAPAMSEPQPAMVGPASIGVEQSSWPSSPVLSHAREATLATSEPQLARVEPATDGVEQSLRPSSPMTNRAMAAAPATSESRPAAVDLAPVGGEQSSRPSSPTSFAVETAAAASELQPVRVDPTPSRAGQWARPSLTDPRLDQTAEVMAASDSLRPEVPTAGRADAAVPNEPRRAGEGVQVAGTLESSRWAAGPTLAPDATRPMATDGIATMPADPTFVDEMMSPNLMATMIDDPRANGEARPDPIPVVREQTLPHEQISYGPIGADRPGRFEPMLAVAADGSIRKEEQPLPDPTSAVHQPAVDVGASSVAERAPLSAAQRLAWEAYLSASGESFAPARAAAPTMTAAFAPQAIAALTVAQRSPAGSQEGNRPSDPMPTALPAVDRQPDSLPVASPAANRQPDSLPVASPAANRQSDSSPALPISAPSAMRTELMASWRPAPGPIPSAAREEHESSPLRRASGQSVSVSVRLETPMQPHVADLASASAPAADQASSRPPAQPADGPARHEVSAQPPVADVVGIAVPREGPPVVTEAVADPVFEAEAAEGFQELLDRIQIAVRRGESTWKLQLRPPSLGRLEVHLTTGAKGLEIVMRTETAEAQAFLQANLPELSRGLDQRGVVVERCEVSCGQPGADLPGAPGEGRQQAGAAWQFAQPAVPLPAPTARRNTAPTTNNTGAHSRSLVDLQA